MTVKEYVIIHKDMYTYLINRYLKISQVPKLIDEINQIAKQLNIFEITDEKVKVYKLLK